MKDFIKEYVKIIINILCTVVLSLGFYNIFVNLLHQNYINDTIVVSSLDKNYSTFKSNISTIEKNLNKYNYNSISREYDMETMEKLRSKVTVCLNELKKDKTVYRLNNNDRVKPFDLYEVNINFLNGIINQCWVSGFSFINIDDNNYNGYFKEIFPRYNQTVNLLVDNSNYVKLELMNNSSYHYSTDVFKNTVRNEFLSQYNMVINNYKNFSDIILEISDYLVKGEY